MLVVEDNAAEALLIEEAFAAVSVPVDLERVSNGKQALERLRTDAAGRRPTLVLMDNHLPDMRGTELARILSTDPGYGHPRIVLLSGDLVRDSQGDWEDWLEKPASWHEWEGLARELLQRFLIGSTPER